MIPRTALSCFIRRRHHVISREDVGQCWVFLLETHPQKLVNEAPNKEEVRQRTETNNKIENLNKKIWDKSIVQTDNVLRKGRIDQLAEDWVNGGDTDLVWEDLTRCL